jgi:hypothetical protein
MWKQHKVKTVGNLIDVLPKTPYSLLVDCPHCKQTAPAHNYDGSWYETHCRASKRTFKPTVRALLQSLYDNNYS